MVEEYLQSQESFSKIMKNTALQEVTLNRFTSLHKALTELFKLNF